MHLICGPCFDKAGKPEELKPSRLLRSLFTMCAYCKKGLEAEEYKTAHVLSGDTPKMDICKTLGISLSHSSRFDFVDQRRDTAFQAELESSPHEVVKRAMDWLRDQDQRVFYPIALLIEHLYAKAYPTEVRVAAWIPLPPLRTDLFRPGRPTYPIESTLMHLMVVDHFDDHVSAEAHRRKVDQFLNRTGLPGDVKVKGSSSGIWPKPFCVYIEFEHAHQAGTVRLALERASQRLLPDPST